MTRTPTLERPHPIAPGTQKLYRFPNGYGASVVQFPYSYGGKEGKWELAVMRYHGPADDDCEITYDTPVTSDVIGWLTDEEVETTLSAIEALPEATDDDQG